MAPPRRLPTQGTFQEYALLYRSASTGIALLVFAPSLAAQSTVRPLPRAAVPSALAWSLVSPFPAPAFDPVLVHDDFFPPTTLNRMDEPVKAGPEVDLDLDLVLQPQADLEEGPGSVGVQRGGWDASAGWRTAPDQGLTLTLHTEASFYDFEGATGLVPGSGNGEPLNDVYETSLATTLCTRYTDDIAWFTSGALTLSGEDDASIGNAFTVGMLGGIRYQAHESLALQGGLAVQTLLEDRTWVVPYLGFDWRIQDGLRLLSEGSKVRLEAELDPAWTLYGEAAYELRQYRLNDSNPLSDGVMRDQEIDLGIGLDWRPKPGLTLGLETGITAWREIEFFAEDGNRVSETESDPAPFGALSLSFRF